MPEEQENWDVFIASRPDESGRYRLELSIGQDLAVGLSRAEAIEWGLYVYAMTAVAEFDAAMLRQTRALRMAQELIITLVTETRRERPAQEPPAVVGLRLVPGVNAEAKPFLHLHLNGQAIGQWECRDALRHADGVMMGVATVALDESLLRTLTGQFGMDAVNATQMISDLGRHHQQANTDE